MPFHDWLGCYRLPHLASSCLRVSITIFHFRLSGIDLEPRIRQEINEQHVKLAAIEIPPGVDSRLRTDVQRAIDDSFVAGFRLVMFLGSGLAALSAVTAKLLIESKPKE